MERSFTITEGDGTETKILIRNPEYQDFDESDRVYASKIASMVRDSSKNKLLLRRELDIFLKEQGIWTDADEQKVKSLQKQIDSSLNKIRKGGTKLSEGRKLCIETMDLRKEMVKILSKRQTFESATIESIAESEKLDYLIYVSTVKEDGSFYWESCSDMKNDKMGPVYGKASVMATQLIYGIDSEFERNLPENKWLKKYNFVDAELNYVDRKSGEHVDKDGKPVKQLEQEALKQLENLTGDIVEEQPFVDDDTGEIVQV